MAVYIPSEKGKPGLPQFKISGEQIISENPAISTTLLAQPLQTKLFPLGPLKAAQPLRNSLLLS
jgi:hypothetical protein